MIIDVVDAIVVRTQLLRLPLIFCIHILIDVIPAVLSLFGGHGQVVLVRLALFMSL